MSNNITVTISNQPLMDKITQLQQEISTLEETITSLNSQIADLNQQVEQKQATIDSLNLQISQLQEQVSQLDAQVTALTEQVQTLTLENSQLTQQIGQLQASVQSLNEQITGMINQINAINGETVENPIEYLAQTKSDILTALQNKGSSATSNTTFREYANIISHFNILPDGDEHTLLLMHLDETNQLKDSSIYNRPIIPCGTGIPIITTNTSKFGNGSLHLDGSYGFYVNQTDFFPLSSSGWTVEFFYRPISWIQSTASFTFMANVLQDTIGSTTITRYQRFSAMYTSYRRVIACSYLDFDKTSSSQPVQPYTNENYFQGDSWHHLAWVKNPYDTTYLTRIYHNGTFVTWLNGESSYCRIKDYNFVPFEQIPAFVYFFCRYAVTSSQLTDFAVCYANELRISDVCRYTSDFTPPTEPFSV